MEYTSAEAMVRLMPTNYNMWKPRMEDLLNLKDLAEPIERKGVKPEGKSEEIWAKMNKKTVAQIRQWIDHSVFHHVSQEKDAYKLWEKLEGMYQAKTARNKTLLMRRLVNHKLRNGTSVTEHMSQFQDLVNQLGAAEWVLKDEEQAILLLSSLPESWETLVITLSNSAPGGKVTMEMVTDALLNEEARRKEVGVGADQTYALVSEYRGKWGGRNRGRGQNRGRGRDHVIHREGYDPESSNGNTDQDDKVLICYHCGKAGHKKRNCRKFLKELAQGGQKVEKDDGDTMVTISSDVA